MIETAARELRIRHAFLYGHSAANRHWATLLCHFADDD
jgi:hypothetical protein